MDAAPLRVTALEYRATKPTRSPYYSSLDASTMLFDHSRPRNHLLTGPANAFAERYDVTARGSVSLWHPPAAHAAHGRITLPRPPPHRHFLRKWVDSPRIR
jgi:hypothetical protein